MQLWAFDEAPPSAAKEPKYWHLMRNSACNHLGFSILVPANGAFTLGPLLEGFKPPHEESNSLDS
ncbi:hypothetical protein HMPREF2806_03860 [Corynebacterium sp. HMSC076G08]|nr:hypothetical protein HMPREF2806_03860 [Corynebacterium sp. HMSC076G08]